MKRPTNTAGTILAALVLAVLPALVWAEGDVALKVKSASGTTFKWGYLAKTSFEIENTSNKVIVVQSIEPKTGGEPAVISSWVYGSVAKAKDADKYDFNGMSQRLTALPFHAGMLLPGERVTVVTRYRPTAKQDDFVITYWSAENPYDGSIASLKPFQPYVPGEGTQDAFRITYVPFTESRWKQVASGCQAVAPLGPSNSPRAVLLPGLTGKPVTTTCQVQLSYDGSPFLREEAMAAASRISGKPAEELSVGYSSSLSKYVVFEQGLSWCLASAVQKVKGDLLAAFPAVLLNDLDTSPDVRVRVGDKQVGLGPDVQKSSRKFWNRYPVYYGDGMYTKGEFLHLGNADLLGFLRLARTKGQTLKDTVYFFRSRYYTLQPKDAGKPK